MTPEFIAGKVKVLRDEIISHTPVERHEVVEAGIKLAEMVVIAMCANATNIATIANGITAQTKILCHAYNLSAEEKEKLGIAINDNEELH